jgi:glycosyltransferase involved in cell wall biosynthesis
VKLAKGAMSQLQRLKDLTRRFAAPVIYYPIDSLSRIRERLLDKPAGPMIYYVVDTPGWIQESRLRYLQRYLADIEFKLLTAEEFCRYWNRGWLSSKSIYFASWRILHHYITQGLCPFEPADYDHFMASVTSHQNIGGGLNVSQAIPEGQDPKEALEFAVELLRRLRVVTVNSRILYDLLSPHILELIYTPNGVDAEFFHPPASRRYHPDRIRMGWVGKLRAAKNYQTIEAAFEQLRARGFEPCLVSHSKPVKKEELLSPVEMRSFYQRIDYYLCASWHEGTPNPALEAAACGVPVVSTRVGNMPEFIRHGENGYFIEPTIESIINTFESLQSLRVEEYEQLRSNARRTVEAEWSWERNIQNYCPAFERLLNRTDCGGKGTVRCLLLTALFWTLKSIL